MNPRVIYGAMELIDDEALRARVLEVLCEEEPETGELVRAMFKVPTDTPDPLERSAPAILGIRPRWLNRERFLKLLFDGQLPFDVDGYRLNERIGKGSSGLVFRASPTEDRGTPVAMKFLSRTTAVTDPARRRWNRETSILRSLNHPNVISYLDSGVTDGVPWVVTPFCDAGNLAERLRGAGPLTPSRAVRLADMLLSGMAYAHARGIVHRDLKPANILLESSRGGRFRARIADFGLARDDGDDHSTLTNATDIGGSFDYMPAEQTENFHRATPRSDVWSLGAIVYECLTNTLPRPLTPGAPIQKQFREILEGPMIPIGDVRGDLPPKLVAWVTRALAKSPDDRFEDAGAMLRALQETVSAIGILP